MFLVVHCQDLGVPEERDLVVENGQPRHSDSMIEGPYCDTGPDERLEFAFPDYNVT